jgi:hypothetical protein
MLDAIKLALIRAHNTTEAPNVVRVAAHASLLLLLKYHSLMDDCDMYPIAIGKLFQHVIMVINTQNIYLQVMSPDKKLK